MKDNTNTSAEVGPVQMFIDGQVAHVGWPLQKNGTFARLSVQFSDGAIRECTPDEHERFVAKLAYFYFIKKGRWAQAYGWLGTPTATYRQSSRDGGGALV